MPRPLPACAVRPDLFQDDDLISPPSRRSVTAARWREYEAKVRTAHRRCAACPVLDACLYHAVVEVDVAGYLACTSEEDRDAMRQHLGIEISEGDPVLTMRVGGPVDHDAVLAARAAHPTDTYQQLADRVGCSLSTVKRHLRRERALTRAQGCDEVIEARSARPTMSAVLDAFDELDTSHTA